MRKRLTFELTAILSVLLTLLAACGTNISTSNAPAAPVTAPITVPAGENIYVLDHYTTSNYETIDPSVRHIVGLHPGNSSSTPVMTLPDGLLSQDHQRLYTAIPRNGYTTVTVINTRTGAAIRKFNIDCVFGSATRGEDVSALSADGRWFVLHDYTSGFDTTTLMLIDTVAGKLVEQISLPGGDFTLDAISPGGKAIYLLQKLNDSPDHYYVRVYDVNQNQLVETPLVDKTINNPSGDANMSGEALTRQVLNGGAFAYTLYTDTLHNLAFVHILPLNDQIQPLVAHCVDLPVGKSASLLRYYTLTLSADGKMLYAANGALGIVARIPLDNSDPTSIFNDLLQTVKRFDPGTINMTIGNQSRSLYNAAALSSDGSTLFFAGVQGIWAVNTSDLSIKTHYLTQLSLTSIALSSNNQLLYAVDPTSGITLVNDGNGRPQQVIQGAVNNPWGISWIDN